MEGVAIPEVTSRLKKKTSQGKVFMTKTKIDKAEIVSIVKCNQVDKHDDRYLWLNEEVPIIWSREFKEVKIISQSFMDSLCR